MKMDFKFILTIILSCFASVLICKGQCKPGIENVTRPRMWFDKQEGQDRITNFRLTKKPVLNYNSGMDQFGRVNLGNFLGMLSYFEHFADYGELKIYIGMYSDEGAPNVPPGFGKQLTLVFSPADAAGKDLNPALFYVIPPNKYFDEKNLRDFRINAAAKDELVNNYFAKMPISTIDPGNDHNICTTCSYRGPTDTRSIIYDKDLLAELITEQEYCHKDLTNTIDINISKNFIAFFTAQNINLTTRDNYRITIAFEFTDSTYNPVNLEDTFGFFNRGIIKPVDNGQLCPTYCP